MAFTPSVTPNLRRGLDLGNILEQSIRAQGQRKIVMITVTMKITGENVAAQFTSSTGWQNVQFTGTRKGGICNLTGTNAGETDVYTGRCDAAGFSGKAIAYASNGRGASGPFELNAISYEDTTERDARRAELKTLCDGGRGKQAACVELDQK